MLQAAPGHLESQLSAAEVYGRKGRRLLEAAAVKRARNIAGPDHPDVHRAVVRFAQRGGCNRVIHSVGVQAVASLAVSTAAVMLNMHLHTTCASTNCGDATELMAH